MIAIARILSIALGTQDDVETLQTIAIFCGIGLVASLVCLLSGSNPAFGSF